MSIVFVTGNQFKFSEVSSLLDGPIWQKEIDLPEIQAVNPQDVIQAKLKSAYELLKTPVIVEDTSLGFDALNGLPGALIKWFLERLGNEGLCRLVEQYESKAATAVTVIGYFDGTKPLFFTGAVTGIIVETPRGTTGFGWDPIFQPDKSINTFAEMTNVEKSEYSMRKTAVLKLKAHLQKNS
ncbi:MAG: non-canonical purine NTP pyrophosphatase [Chloroflexota bacterium]